MQPRQDHPRRRAEPVGNDPVNESVESLQKRFADVLDGDQIEMRADGFPQLDLHEPALVLLPKTAEQLSETLRCASASKTPIIPTGLGTALRLGNLPTASGAFLSTRLMNGIVDYEPRDLTVIAQAGLSIEMLQKTAAEEKQRLALDPPSAGTLGGLVAMDASGPLRDAYGSTRDLCLGVRAALADGTLVKGGGRVVKNAAGYDLTRLLVGSFGTLGVVYEAAFRLHPQPEKTAAVSAEFESWGGAFETAANLARSELEPEWLAVLRLDETSAPAAAVGFGGHPETVEYQTKRAQEIMSKEGPKALKTQPSSEGALETMRSRLSAALNDPIRMTCRVFAPLSALSEIVKAAERLRPASWQIRSLSGVGYAVFDDPSADTVRELRQEASERGGAVVVESAPIAVKREIDVWGPPTGPLSLMRAVKQKLDPHLLLNRGPLYKGAGQRRRPLNSPSPSFPLLQVKRAGIQKAVDAQRRF